MLLFWKNVGQFPRFFITSVIGSALVIIAPFRNLFKVPKLRIFLVILIFGIIGGLYAVLRSMAGI